MQSGDEASPSINPAGRGLLVKMLILLNLMVYFDQTLHIFIFYRCLDNVRQNGDQALPSIIPASRGQLVKMLITLELHGIF